MSVKSNKIKSRPTSSSWDIEKGPIIIVEPIKRTPIDEISLLEREIAKSLMPISKSDASLYFMQGNPLEREQKAMLEEDLSSYAREMNDPSKFMLARGIRKTRKTRKTRKPRKTRKTRKYKNTSKKHANKKSQRRHKNDKK